MKKKPHRPPALGFSRCDVLALTAGLLALTTVGLSAVGGSRRATDLAACVNNLRQIGRAFQLWGHDHNDDRPTWTPLSEGGVKGHPLAGNAWLQFSWISNELASPRILACPSDERRVAKDFGNSADGGFLNSGYRNNAVSYFIGSDATKLLPVSFVSGDRNVNWRSIGSCSVGINNAYSLTAYPTAGNTWTNAIHGLWGSILLYNGEVLTGSNPTMRPWLLTGDANGSIHMILP